MKHIDIWPALGVTAGAVVGSLVVSMFIYNLSTPLETADVIGVVLGAVVLALFSYIYFKQTSVKPSAQSGFYLGCVMVAYTFVTGFLSGYVAAAQGYPVVQLPPPASWVMWGSLLVGFAAPTLVGWFLSKR